MHSESTLLTDARLKRFTVEDYHRMGDAGILGEDDRVELIEGEIIQMSPIGDAHVGCVNFLTDFLTGRLRGRFTVSIQNPVRLEKHSEPQPDVSLLRKRNGLNGRHVPIAAETIAVFEVSDTTLKYDRDIKLPLYAAANIPEAWIIDLQGQAIERHNQPVEGSYQSIARAVRGEGLRSTVAPELTLSVDDVLGP